MLGMTWIGFRRRSCNGRGEQKSATATLLVVVGALVASVQVASAVTIFTASLTGDQVSPPTGSTTGGLAILVLNDAQDRLEISFEEGACPPCVGPGIISIDLDGSWTPGNPDDDVTGFHIHRGAPGVNGPEVFGFIGPNSDLNGDLVINASGATLTGAWNSNEGIGTTLDAELSNLFAENLYIDLHTNLFPAGEIRGRIVPEPRTAALVIVGLLALAASGMRKSS